MEGHVYDLRKFGWDNCSVQANLTDICSAIPTWKDLKPLRPPHKEGDIYIRFPKSWFKDPTHGNYMPGIVKLVQTDDGGYAQIFKGRRALFIQEHAHETELHLRKITPFTEVCIKEIAVSIDPDDKSGESSYEDEIHAILYEAFIHALLCKTMEAAGFIGVVPRMYEVVATTKTQSETKASDYESLWITMEFIEGQTLEKYLASHLKRESYAQNERLLKDVIIQLAFYLHILQEKIRFNHRDLKVNNVFVRHTASDWSQTLALPHGTSYVCQHSIVLIDFGFSCIACGPDGTGSLVCAGSWFKPADICLKYGRDLAQFLYSLHCLYYLPNYVSRPFFDKIYNSMYTSYNGRIINLLHGVNASGEPLPSPHTLEPITFNDGIYMFLREPAIDMPGCTPSVLLERMAAVNREN
jgi:serine/threonine protein kinase